MQEIHTNRCTHVCYRDPACKKHNYLAGQGVVMVNILLTTSSSAHTFT